MKYAHAHLLRDHFEKGAFLGMAARMLGGPVLNAAERFAGPAAGRMAQGALGRVGAGALGTGCQATRGALGMGGSGIGGAAGRLGASVSPAASAMRSGQGGASMFGMKLSGCELVDKLAMEILSNDGAPYDLAHRALGAGSYAAFALPYLMPSLHSNPTATNALNAAGLVGLGVNSIRDLAHGDKPSLMDLGGLGLMGGRMLYDKLHGVKSPALPAP
jgi:hypothetical protein